MNVTSTHPASFDSRGVAFSRRQLPISRILVSLLLACTFLTASVKAELTVHVQDGAGNPLSPVRIQIFPGALDPDSDMHPIPPPKPRVDGLVGFVTNEQGRVNLDLPPGLYTVVASTDRDFEDIGRSFLIAREVNAPGEVRLSLADTIPVTVSAVGEGDFGVSSRPLLGGFVYFRPSKGTRGLVGKINNDGQLQTVISPGRYHVIISSSIESHYIVVTDQLRRHG